MLKRYRTTSLLGWVIVFAACLSAPLGWNLGRSTGFIEVVLTVLTVVAGLVLVWQNISALEEYIRIPFPVPSPPEQPEVQSPVITEIKNMMHEVDEGGWQEAYAAIGKLRQIQITYGLQKLD